MTPHPSKTEKIVTYPSPEDLEAKYQWVVAMLKKEFPRFRAWSHTCDWGRGFAIGVEFPNGDRKGVVLEEDGVQLATPETVQALVDKWKSQYKETK